MGEKKKTQWTYRVLLHDDADESPYGEFSAWYSTNEKFASSSAAVRAAIDRFGNDNEIAVIAV